MLRHCHGAGILDAQIIGCETMNLSLLIGKRRTYLDCSINKMGRHRCAKASVTNDWNKVCTLCSHIELLWGLQLQKKQSIECAMIFWLHFLGVAAKQPTSNERTSLRSLTELNQGSLVIKCMRDPQYNLHHILSVTILFSSADLVIQRCLFMFIMVQVNLRSVEEYILVCSRPLSAVCIHD